VYYGAFYRSMDPAQCSAKLANKSVSSGNDRSLSVQFFTFGVVNPILSYNCEGLGETIPPLAFPGGLDLIASARTTFASDLIALTEQPNRTLKTLASRPPIEIPAESFPAVKCPTR
jgi:hypothetical protein